MAKQPYKVDRDNLPPELRGVVSDALEGAIKNTEKAKNTAIERQERQREAHEELVKSGKALDLIASAKRCYRSGSSGTEQIVGH